MELDSFAKELFQDIVTAAGADGEMIEDIAFEKLCEAVTEAGEMATADRVAYHGPPGSGIRVDGYSGDPLEDAAGTLGLIILDFDHSLSGSRLTNTEMSALFRRLSSFLRHALDPRWRNALEETAPAFGLADLIAHSLVKGDQGPSPLGQQSEVERASGRAGERDTRWSSGDLQRLGSSPAVQVRRSRPGSRGHRRGPVRGVRWATCDPAGRSVEGRLRVISRRNAGAGARRDLRPFRRAAPGAERPGVPSSSREGQPRDQEHSRERALQVLCLQQRHHGYSRGGGYRAEQRSTPAAPDEELSDRERRSNDRVASRGVPRAVRCQEDRGRPVPNLRPGQTDRRRSGTGHRTRAEDLGVREHTEPGQRRRLLLEPPLPRPVGELLAPDLRTFRGGYIPAVEVVLRKSARPVRRRTGPSTAQRLSARSSTWRVRGGSSSPRRT